MCLNNKSVLYADDTILDHMSTSLEEPTNKVKNRLRVFFGMVRLQKALNEPFKIRIHDCD